MINRSNNLFVNYPFIPIIILTILVIDVLADSPNNKDFRNVVDLTLTMIVLGSFGCLYVFYRIYKQWILSKKNLAMIYKLPYYTACTDCLINLSFFINIMHTALYAQVWDEPLCKILSATNWGFITINLCFYGVIATITYLRICQEIYFDYGKYDYKIWAIVIAISLPLQLINIRNHGARRFWCSGKSGQITGPIILFSLISVVLVIICFCYVNVLNKIWHTRKRSKTTSPSNRSENGIESTILEKRAEIERRAARKIMSYILIFAIQWVPLGISLAARFLKSNDGTWVYFLASLGRSFGGIGNAIQFIINEGWIVQEPTEFDTPMPRSQETNNKSTQSINNSYSLTELNKVNTNNNNNNDDENYNLLSKNMKNAEQLEPIINIIDNNMNSEGSNQV
ncbi:hypothetical protein C1645_878242 [Glomus cerebriforme]|uniref:G-protein coupled receptors family 1 profile domain-containing protein n=1 Tax=Glomus cerebriforme TaxID=658196 RepID=A0A397SN31_9GLOM|nr:hypothetical protein C1645_878242 [Glomus cerebriforme]